jgi:hypothetical protein
MSSCPIAASRQTLAADDTSPIDLTDRDRHDLVAVLAEVPDPRDPRGIRYRPASLSAVAVCAVPAGAVTFADIAD